MEVAPGTGFGAGGLHFHADRFQAAQDPVAHFSFPRPKDGIIPVPIARNVFEMKM